MERSEAMKDVITVGLDGTPESLSAARWAAREARLRAARLRLLHAWVMLAQEPSSPAPDERDQNYWPHRLMNEAREAVRAREPDLPLDETLVNHDPLEALKEAAAQSDLLVLGSRALGALSRYVLGETGLHLVAHTETPVVLVRARQEGAERPDDVVVGLSLHGPCEALLAFAFHSAARRGVTLRAVHGQHLPAHAYNRGGGVEPYAAKTAAQDARQELAEALRPWREKFPDVVVDARVELESPAPALLRDATDAGLLIVGRRRKRRLAPRIGHVVQAVVHHAPCAVAVVPHE
ncbi:universal stress protein [Streptomyces sp. NPDC048650]|uniref:universal stress protein n=1 Tax=unclassified Streptomyces TaxID=2593676 RepID=UPI00371A93B2